MSNSGHNNFKQGVIEHYQSPLRSNTFNHPGASFLPTSATSWPFNLSSRSNSVLHKPSQSGHPGSKPSRQQRHSMSHPQGLNPGYMNGIPNLHVHHGNGGVNHYGSLQGPSQGLVQSPANGIGQRHPYTHGPNGPDPLYGQKGSEDNHTKGQNSQRNTEASQNGHGAAEVEEKERGPKIIYFYDKDEPYYSFTNFSDHKIKYKGKDYPTSEHLFQAMKFIDHRPLLAEHIRTCSPNARDAFKEARRLEPQVRLDWKERRLEFMLDILMLKFQQHKKLGRELRDTKDAILIEDSPIDAYWGNGPRKDGENNLGKTLMQVRRILFE